MPNARLLNSVQSATHGLVLFCPIDNGRTRIGKPQRLSGLFIQARPEPDAICPLGYVFNEELQDKYGRAPISKEVAMEVSQARRAR